MWLRLDDAFPSHPKVAQLGDRAFRVHVSALCYAAKYATDGFVPGGALPSLGGRRTHALECVRAGVWESVEGGWLVHDFLVYNPSKAEQDAAAEARTSKARNAAHARWGTPDAASNAPSIPVALLGGLLGDAPSRPALERDPHTPLRGACSKHDTPHLQCRGCGTNPRAVLAAQRRRNDLQRCPAHPAERAASCRSCAADLLAGEA